VGCGGAAGLPAAPCPLGACTASPSEGALRLLVASTHTPTSVHSTLPQLQNMRVRVTSSSIPFHCIAFHRVVTPAAPSPPPSQGIGAGFIPGNLDVSILDETIQVRECVCVCVCVCVRARVHASVWGGGGKRGGVGQGGDLSPYSTARPQWVQAFVLAPLSPTCLPAGPTALHAHPRCRCPAMLLWPWPGGWPWRRGCCVGSAAGRRWRRQCR
jgi:hypothetical protein